MDLDGFGRGLFLNKVCVMPNNLDGSCGFIGESIGAKGWKAGLMVGNGGEVVNNVGLCRSDSICSSFAFNFLIFFSF